MDKAIINYSDSAKCHDLAVIYSEKTFDFHRGTPEAFGEAYADIYLKIEDGFKLDKPKAKSVEFLK